MFPIFKNAAIVPSKKRKVNVCLSPKDYLNTTASSIIKNLYHLSPAGLTNIFAAAILDSMKKKWILVSITVAAVLAYWLLFSGISADELDTFIRGFGPWAPLAYVAAFTVLPAFFFPVAVLALAGGLLFGFWAGAAYTFLGAVLNCTLMFFLARRLGKSPQSFNSKMKRESFTVEDLEKIADVLGVEFNREFILANGDKV